MGTSSVKNGRDSQAKSRGVKVLGGQPVKAGGIIVRQLGNKWYAGNNVGKGNDYTLFSKEEGIVVFEKIKSRKSVSVYPHGHEKATGWHLEMQPNSRKAQRLAKWKGTPRGRQSRPGLRPGPDGNGNGSAIEATAPAPQEPAAAAA